MTQERRRTVLREQKAQHVYNRVPARSHATVAPRTTQEPEASRHRAGHYAGIHPEDTPRTTGSYGVQRQSVPMTNPPLEEEEEELERAYETPRPPSSVRRYQGNKKPAPRRARLPHIMIVGGSIVVGITLALVVPPLWTSGMNQVQYGFPRLSQVEATVGHGTTQAPSTRFLAMNNHGLIEVVEIPTGTPGKDDLHLYLVAQLSGKEADQAPVTISFEDVNGDHKPDMVVTCSDNKFILYNDGHRFKNAL
ncbi:hypothetical protein KSF_052680 [Reticulibacter mediterranei]|uniref:VCBS repeat-containing protein n=1 Tax=Reticulibacter mediterranei TaxID=2778369 RepID=A0A8J3IQV8_9CHLR|nr:hypothetical protein [Reticulibacter mediterranei]GHO95220.1 hypothetical protein KSF_052680 [Reticulibacter mediterranei]